MVLANPTSRWCLPKLLTCGTHLRGGALPGSCASISASCLKSSMFSAKMLLRCVSTVNTLTCSNRRGVRECVCVCVCEMLFFSHILALVQRLKSFTNF